MYGGNPFSPRRRRAREIEPPAGVPPSGPPTARSSCCERRRGGCRCTSVRAARPNPHCESIGAQV